MVVSEGDHVSFNSFQRIFSEVNFHLEVTGSSESNLFRWRKWRKLEVYGVGGGLQPVLGTSKLETVKFYEYKEFFDFTKLVSSYEFPNSLLDQHPN